MVFATPATAAWSKHVCKIISLERRATFGGGSEGFNGKRHGLLVPWYRHRPSQQAKLDE
ncbi:hypothetical protein HY772_10545 [Candidatus Woesearchaeota archaeon]|nr:hypothetical protein [Candidatus Woesearchaeota archaeon]